MPSFQLHFTPPALINRRICSCSCNYLSTGFILFPGSDHVETVIVFDKKEKNVHQEI